MASLKTTTTATAPATTPKKKSRARAPLPAIQTGQIWQMQDANLRIDLIGKTLVHYKLFRGGVQRAPVSLTGRAALAYLAASAMSSTTSRRTASWPPIRT